MLSFSEVKQEGEKRRIFGKRQVSTDPWGSRHNLNPDFFCHFILLKVTNILKLWKHIRSIQSMVLNDPVYVISITLPCVKEKTRYNRLHLPPMQQPRKSELISASSKPKRQKCICIVVSPAFPGGTFVLFSTTESRPLAEILPNLSFISCRIFLLIFLDCELSQNFLWITVCKFHKKDGFLSNIPISVWRWFSQGRCFEMAS